IVNACKKMSSSKTGALIVIQRNNSLDFVKKSGDRMYLRVNRPIIESVFFKNSPLHDGAAIIEENHITATRVILPLSTDRGIPLRFGLRHRAAVGITEKTDALCLVVSEETGRVSYLKEGDFVLFETMGQLTQLLKKDLST
ncbi:MAG: diadenylate cyclase, partial [Marinirhabdus sp.]